MKKPLLLILILFAAIKLFAAGNNIDSLKQKLQVTTNDSLKAFVYTDLASQYMGYDTIASRYKKSIYQENALNYTMQALHLFSRYNDTTGLRICFDKLAKVYHAQKKYSQAKWFILQSNNLSRIKGDTHNIIASLIELAAIKSDIKDYNLAMKDLNEALKISTANYYPEDEAIVQENYSILYNRLKDYTKADIALKRHDSILDSIHKDKEASLLTKLNVQDSVVAKKKLYTVNNRKSYKINYTKRIASL